VTPALNFISKRTVFCVTKNKVAVIFEGNAIKSFEGSNGGKAPPHIQTSVLYIGFALRPFCPLRMSSHIFRIRETGWASERE
jgi:hypothetical protein